MAVSFVAAGAVASRANAYGTLTPALPAGVAAGDLLVCYAWAKHAEAAFAMPGKGWVPAGRFVTASAAADGVDTGNIVGYAFVKVHAAGETAPVITTGGSFSTIGAASHAAVVTAWRKTLAKWRVLAARGAVDSVPGNSLALDFAVNVPTGATLALGLFLNGDLPTFGATTLAQTGAVFSATTDRVASTAVTAGNDTRGIVRSATVTSALATGTLAATTALAGTTTNAVGLGFLHALTDVAVNDPPVVAPTGPASTTEAGAVTVTTGVTDEDPLARRFTSKPVGPRYGSLDDPAAAAPVFTPFGATSSPLDEAFTFPDGSSPTLSPLIARTGVGNTNAGSTAGMVVDVQGGAVRVLHQRNNDNGNLYGSAATEHADADLTIRYVSNSLNSETSERGNRCLYLRTPDSFLDESSYYLTAGLTGWMAQLSHGSTTSAVRLQRLGASDGVTVGEFPYAKADAAGTLDTWLRFQVVGDRVRVKAWLSDQAEPAEWGIVVVDAGAPGVGRFHVRSRSFASGAGNLIYDVRFDDVHLEVT